MMAPALVLTELGQRPRIEMVSIAPPGPAEVLVEIRASGVCHTDLRAPYDAQALPLVLGHEGAGVVAVVGDNVGSPRVGDHVVINWQAKCGACRHCVTGRREYCENIQATRSPRLHLRGQPLRAMLNAGTFCPYVVVPAQGAITIRPDMPFAKAALLGCAVATGLGAPLYSAHVRAGDTVVVIGTGGVGLNAVQGARLCNAATIIAVDRDAQKLETARELGATHCVDGSADDAVAAVREITAGRGVDHVFEVVGDPLLMAHGIAMLARSGTLTLIGATARGDVLSISPRALMSKQQRIRGCIYGNITPERDLPLFADWYVDGRIQLDQLHTGTIPFNEIEALFAPDHVHRGVRTIVTMAD